MNHTHKHKAQLLIYLLPPINFYLRLTGGLCIRTSVGGSVANASAPRVSWMRLTQRSCPKRKPAKHRIHTETNRCRNRSKSLTERERERGDQTCTVFSGTSPEETAAMTFIAIAATLIVSWNWMNFWIFAYTDRPHLTTCMVSKIGEDYFKKFKDFIQKRNSN